jgi:hypothetical protein
MKRTFFIVATVLASCSAASAQAPKAVATSASAPTAPVMTMAPGWRAPATSVPAPITTAAFGCDARAANVCHFRIFYTRGDRVVILAAGMKATKVPVIVGGNYCMTLGKTPAVKCARKVINDKYNS